MTGALKIAALQHDIVWEDPKATFALVAPQIAAAAAGGARLIVLTEMFSTGFSMATDRVAEERGGASEEFLRAAAREHAVWLIASVPQFWSGADRPRNVALVVSPDGDVSRYAKIHPFRYGGETEFYSAGTETLTVEVDGLRVTPLICYDLRFADTFWGLASTTDCFVVVANWPAARREHWMTLLAARAIENQAYVVGVNRAGQAPGLSYAGDSRIIDPWGTVLASAGDAETVLFADLDPEVVATTRARFPVFADR